jgi:Zn-finger nucleic acid-binding protein
MRTYERNGVLIGQCDDCRGIFLDRGEIDRLIDAATPSATQETGPRGAHGRSRKTRSRVDATTIADMLVLLASEPSHPAPSRDHHSP